MSGNGSWALGLIETKGYLPLVTAVDGALKAAQVTLESRHLVGGGLSTATVRGDVGSITAALAAAAAIISSMGAEGLTHVIPRPDPAVWAMLEKDGLCLDTPGGGCGGRTEISRREPASEVEAGLPVLKEEADVPALRAEAEVPVLKPPAGLPVALEDSGAYETPGPANSAKKTTAKPKKPRKPGKK